MLFFRRHSFIADAFRRTIAVGGVALLLLLTVLGASPNLHRLFHGHDDVSGEDGCAVVQFAHGVSFTPDTAVLASTPVEWRAQIRAGVVEIFLSSPRYLHQPERGPPVS